MEEENTFKLKYLFLMIILGIIAIMAFSSFYTVQAGQRAVILTWGEPSQFAVSEGLHFKYPIAQEVIKIDVKTQKYETPASAASKDLQVVSTIIAVNYHLVPESTPNLYKDIGLDYEAKVIQPVVQEVVKSATAQFTAEELITKRALVKEEIESQLKERLQNRYMQVETISITNFDFSSSFNAAIEAKVTAEQNALQAKNVLEQRKYEAEQVEVTAKAQAEAIRIQAEAITQQGGKDYVQLKAIEKWNGNLPTITMGGSSTPFIDVSSILKEQTV